MILEDYCGTTMGGSFHAKIEDEKMKMIVEFKEEEGERQKRELGPDHEGHYRCQMLRHVNFILMRWLDLPSRWVTMAASWRMSPRCCKITDASKSSSPSSKTRLALP